MQPQRLTRIPNEENAKTTPSSQVLDDKCAGVAVILLILSQWAQANYIKYQQQEQQSKQTKFVLVQKKKSLINDKYNNIGKYKICL